MCEPSGCSTDGRGVNVSRIVALTAAAMLLVSADTPEKIGAWSVTSKVDAMTDRLDAKASVYSSDEKALLSIGCWDGPRESRIAFFLTSDQFLGSSNGVRGRARREIIFRIDQNPAETLWWYYGDTTATQFTMAGVSEFGNILRRGTDLKARMVTYRGNEIDASFDVSGASEAIDRIRLLCSKK